MPRLLVSTYGRTNETDAQVFADGAELEGGALGFIAYGTPGSDTSQFSSSILRRSFSCFVGVHATLYFLCLALFWQERKQKDRRAWPWIAYMTVLFIVGSIINGLNVSFLKADFIDNRDYPGGPSAFTVQNRSLPSRVCTVITVIGTWFVDGLLVCHLIIAILLSESPTCSGFPLLCHFGAQPVGHDHSLWHVHGQYLLVISTSCGVAD